MRITIITGARDSGKTRAAASAVDLMLRKGIRVGGVIAEAELSDGVKVRFSYRDILTGRRQVYALRRQGPLPPGGLAWTFIDEGLEFGRAAVRRAVDARDGAAVLVVDEVGPLEMSGAGLWEPLRDAVTGFPGRIILTVRPALLDTLRDKLGLGPAEAQVIPPEESASIT